LDVANAAGDHLAGSGNIGGAECIAVETIAMVTQISQTSSASG
jgi:hypothetical protein